MATTPAANPRSTDDLLASLASEEIDKLLAEDATLLVDPPPVLVAAMQPEPAPATPEVPAPDALELPPQAIAKDETPSIPPPDDLDLIDAVVRTAESVPIPPQPPSDPPATPQSPAAATTVPEPPTEPEPEPVAETGEAGGQKFIVVKDGSWRKKPTVAPGLTDRDLSTPEPDAVVIKQPRDTSPVAADQIIPGDRDPTPAEDTLIRSAETDSSAAAPDAIAADRPAESDPAPVDTQEESNEVVADLSALEQHITSADVPLVAAPGSSIPASAPPRAGHSGPPFVQVPENWSPQESAIDVLSSLSEPESVRWVWLRKGLELLSRPLDAVGEKARDLIGKIAIVTLFNGTAVLIYVYFVRGG